MDAICLNDIKNLIQRDGGAHVSIFMPAHSGGGMDQQDPIRLKNLLRRAEDKLIANGLRTAEARTFIRPAEALLTDNLFWRRQSDGLALFIEPSMYFYYRVPLVLREEVGVGARYYIKPLISLLSECGWFYVLAVSRGEVRLMQCTASGSVRLELGNIPTNIEEALRLDVPDRVTHYHSSVTASGGNTPAGVSGIQTGMPTAGDYIKDNMITYFERVNKGISAILRNEIAPMVLAGVDYLHPIYRKTNSYRNLLPGGIEGNPDGVSDDTLREQAWTVVRPYFEKTQNDAIAEYNKSAGTGVTAAGIEDVVQMSFQGRVRFLFVAENAQFGGKFDAEAGTVKVNPRPEPTDEDLVDLAAFQTLNHAGTIYVLRPEQVPGGAAISAIQRF